MKIFNKGETYAKEAVYSLKSVDKSPLTGVDYAIVRGCDGNVQEITLMQDEIVKMTEGSPDFDRAANFLGSQIPEKIKSERMPPFIELQGESPYWYSSQLIVELGFNNAIFTNRYLPIDLRSKTESFNWVHSLHLTEKDAKKIAEYYDRPRKFQTQIAASHSFVTKQTLEAMASNCGSVWVFNYGPQR